MRAPSLLQNFSNADFELEAQGITDAVDAMSPPDLRGLNMHGSVSCSTLFAPGPRWS